MTWRAVWPTANVQTNLNVCLTLTRRSQNDDQTSDMIGVERQPSVDLGQLVSDDVERIGSCRLPWHLVWPFWESDNQATSVICE